MLFTKQRLRQTKGKRMWGTQRESLRHDTAGTPAPSETPDTKACDGVEQIYLASQRLQHKIFNYI